MNEFSEWKISKTPFFAANAALLVVAAVVVEKAAHPISVWEMVAVIVFSPAANTDPAQIANSINLWLEQAFPYAVAISVVIAGINLYRILRLKGKPVSGPILPAANSLGYPAHQQTLEDKVGRAVRDFVACYPD